jgi:hypothetical protein
MEQMQLGPRRVWDHDPDLDRSASSAVVNGGENGGSLGVI